MSHNLWNANWTTPPDELAAKLNDSLPYDQRMAQVDVQGSIAWVHALAEAELISCAEAGTLEQGLKAILAEFESGSFEFKPGDEDIHTAVERRLGELSGAVGGKLHTGRSRNDQVATDFR
ncbi:argininosuccinate lyase, partial [bacterium]|nr:argininosuccinate lyase [bacterium]